MAPAGAPLNRPLADFSVNVNPLGPSPAAVAAVRRCALDRYPDPDAGALLNALSAELDVPASWLLATNGTAEAIWLLAAAFVEPGDPCLIAAPAFGEYAPAALAAGATVEYWPDDPHAGLEPDATALSAAIRARRPRITCLCNPNNPSGYYWTAGAVAEVVAAVAETGGLLLLDEAYRAFVPVGWDALPLVAGGHVVLLRSMTKDLALAGLRLGYVVAHPAHTAALAAARPPWSVNALAQAAGVAALADVAHRRVSLQATRDLTRQLGQTLTAAGYAPLPTATNFMLVPVGDGAAFKASLLADGLLVRDCASFGLPGHVRLAARPWPEIERLAAALRLLGPPAGG